MSLDRVGQFLRTRPLTSPVSALVLLGLVVLAWSAIRRRERESRVILTVAGISVAGVLYGYLVQYERLAGRLLPTVVPAFHFLYYVGAVAAAGFGIGCATLVRRAEQFFEFARPSRSGMTSPAVIIATVVLVGSIVTTLPAYRARTDFTDFRDSSLTMFQAPALNAMREWLGPNASDQDVFLASDSLGQSVIATAGRKVVAVSKDFSSPYVNWESRRDARDEMFRRLASAEGRRFTELATRYEVRVRARQTKRTQPNRCRSVTFGWSGRQTTGRSTVSRRTRTRGPGLQARQPRG